MEIGLYAGIGLAAGFFAGLLGIGGGAIVAPLLILTWSNIYPSAVATHMAIGTTMAVIFITAVPSFLTHARNGLVHWRIGAWMVAGAVGGALAGALGAGLVPPTWLSFLLAMFLLRIAFVMFRGVRPAPSSAAVSAAGEAAKMRLVAAGAVIGAIASLMAGGGGAMIVPYLSNRGLNVAQAIGTSAFVSFPLSLFAASGYVIGGWQNAHLPEQTWGFIYLPALANIAAFSIIGALAGARLTARWAEKKLRRTFALLLLLVSAGLLWKTAAG